ncbi:hypothetical protein [Massilia sp. CCM 8734]|uniref:hypothetical protein n=1 Tax=Massilia sp. CCM 8734 TaxID=2609283 RepID=UPI0014226B62|nr:hypothetical protein [Massilia sp. CCM 8734]NHZ98623.1 hypothetical protein [Massilia sp. CCM 8734]
MPASFPFSVQIESKTSPSFVFLPTERAHRFWRYLWPFLSIKQFIFTLAISVVMVIFCIALAPLSLGTIAANIIPIGLVLAIIRMIPAEQLPGKITIASTRGPARQLIPMLEQIMLKCGYTGPAVSVGSNCIQFRPTANGWLSWPAPPKQDVELCIVDENILEVRGPKGILNSIEMDLRWKLMD